MSNKKLSIKTADNFSLSAIHTTTKNAKAIVVWLHGITINKDEYLGMFKDGAEYLESHNVDSLRIDFRGHGKSSGKSTDFTIAGQMIDVQYSLKYINEFYSGKPLPIHIVGCSFGAPPAIFTAIWNPLLIKSIALIAPVLSYKRTFIEPETDWAKELFNKDTISKLNKTGKLKIDDGFDIGLSLYDEMKLIKPEDYLHLVEQKIYIIHGNADSMVPFAVSLDLAVRNDNTIRLVTMENMDHGFNDANDEEGVSEKSLKNKEKIYEIIFNEVINGYQ